MSEGEGFEVTVRTDGGDSAVVHASGDMQVRGFIAEAAAKLYPQSGASPDEYSLSVNGTKFQPVDWAGKTVDELGITASAKVILIAPAPKG